MRTLLALALVLAAASPIAADPAPRTLRKKPKARILLAAKAEMPESTDNSNSCAGFLGLRAEHGGADDVSR